MVALSPSELVALMLVVVTYVSRSKRIDRFITSLKKLTILFSPVGKSHAVPYVTSHPHPGWAEQNPEDWYNNMIGAVRGALKSLEEPAETTTSSSSYNIRAICADTTCCSVVALSHDYTPLRPCLLWMDARSAKQAKQIMSVANEIATSTNSLMHSPSYE